MSGEPKTAEVALAKTWAASLLEGTVAGKTLRPPEDAARTVDGPSARDELH